MLPAILGDMPAKERDRGVIDHNNFAHFDEDYWDADTKMAENELNTGGQINKFDLLAGLLLQSRENEYGVVSARYSGHCRKDKGLCAMNSRYVSPNDFNKVLAGKWVRLTLDTCFAGTFVDQFEQFKNNNTLKPEEIHIYAWCRSD